MIISIASGVLIVTEPTVSGKHDMERVVRLAAHFKVPVPVKPGKAHAEELLQRLKYIKGLLKIL